RETGLPTPCNVSCGADRLRCAAHPGYAGVGMPGDLHHCRGRRLDGDPPAVRLGALRRQLQALGDDPILSKIEEAITAEDWRTAVGLLAIASDNIGKANGAAVKLIARINRTRHSPLLEGLDA
ncbi:hypothetical protein, partial [Synechococcus sp. CCY9202]|uniref:hypothetical protein n=1 Tax=Synechococcus sp. CCY9202 TaxID=174698 RepID=UPI002B216CA4